LGIVFLSILTAGGFALYSLKMEEDIGALLTGDEESQKIHRIFKSFKATERITIYFQTPHQDPMLLSACAERLAETMKAKPEVREIIYQPEEAFFRRFQEILFEELPFFIEPQDYVKIQKQLNPDSICHKLNVASRLLLSPASEMIVPFIVHDPLNISAPILQKLEALKNEETFSSQTGYFTSADNQTIFLFLYPRAPASETAVNSLLIQHLDSTLQQIQKEHPAVSYGYTGSPAVAVCNAKQIRHDIMLSSTVSGVLLLILLLLYFRTFYIFPVFLLPFFSAGALAIIFIFVLKDGVSIISLSLASVLLAITVDYILHLLIHYKHTRSVGKMMKEVVTILLLACFTTAVSFLVLVFHSEALRDFAFFAGVFVFSSAIAALVFLPHFLPSPVGNSIFFQQNSFAKLVEKIAQYPYEKNKILKITLLLLTLISIPALNADLFEGDMNKLSYVSASLQKAEDTLHQLHEHKLKNIFFISYGSTLEETLVEQEKMDFFLQQELKKGNLQKIFSPLFLFKSKKKQKECAQNWNQFWNHSRRDSIQKWFTTLGVQYNFSADAFEPFLKITKKRFEYQSETNRQWLLNSPLGNYFSKSPEGEMYCVSLLRSDAKNKSALYNNYKAIKEQSKKSSTLFTDKQYFINHLVEVLKDNFNFLLNLLIFPLLGIFIFRYRRIEMAFLAILPLLLSWVWLAGIMNLTGFTFNIFNIILCTFIFGLGDDYSIFMLEGMRKEYSGEKNILISYQTSVFLSVLTTLMGMGALGLAKHPVLQSLAALSVIGILCVLMVSRVIQPWLFQKFILERTEKGRPPWTFLKIGNSLLVFFVFLTGSFLLTVGGRFFWYLLPLSLKRKEYLWHVFMMQIAQTVIFLAFRIKVYTENPEKENFRKPAIIVANHHSAIDILVMMALSPKVVLFTNDWVWNSPFFGWVIKKAGYFSTSMGIEKTMTEMKKRIDSGYSIVIFPQGTRTKEGNITRFHKGAFLLARELKTEIIPITLWGTGRAMPKGEVQLQRGVIRINIGKRIPAPYEKEELKNLAKSTSEIIRSNYKALHDLYWKPELWKMIVKDHLLFKTPFLQNELEKNYFQFPTQLENMHQQMPEIGRIAVVGGAYGIPALIFHIASPQREIDSFFTEAREFHFAESLYTHPGNNYLYSDLSKFTPDSATRYDFILITREGRECYSEEMLRQFSELWLNPVL